MRKIYSVLLSVTLSGAFATAGAAESSWNLDELKALQPVMAPEGNIQAYGFYSMGYTVGDFYEDPSLATSVILTDDEVYVKNPLFDYYTGAWIKGRREGSKAVFTFPQTLGKTLHKNTEGSLVSYDYEPIYLFMSKAEEVVVNEGTDDEYSFWTMEIDTESQTLEMEIGEDGTITWGNPDPQYFSDLRGYGAYVVSGDQIFWDKSVELYDKFTPVAEVNNAPPASAAVEQWNYRDSFQYTVVNVAVEGSSLWIQSPDPQQTGGWLKGEISGGTVTFESGQFTGVNDLYRRTSFFMGGIETEFTLSEEDTFLGPKVEASLTLDYDAEAKTLTSPTGKEEFLFIDKKMDASEFEDPEEIYYHLMGQVIAPSLYRFENWDAARPANPSFTDYNYRDYTSWGGTQMTELELLFGTPNVGKNNQTLPVDDCFYRLYLNGELFALDITEFRKLPVSLDGLTDIPYALDEDYGLFTRSLLHVLYLTSEGIETVGVKGFYRAPDGSLLESDLMTLDLATGKVTAESPAGIAAATNAPVLTQEYFNLQGERVENPELGSVYVVRETRADGTVSCRKAVR